MKKLISILTTAAICAAAAAPVMAADEKLTADEIRDMLFAKGICAYPDLCEMTAMNRDDEDILHQTAKVSDVIDINRTINASHIFKINNDLNWTLEENPIKEFSCIGKDAFGTGNSEWYCVIEFYPDDNATYFDLWDNSRYSITLSGFENGIEDIKKYEMIAKAVNEHTDGDLEDIEWVNMYGVPVKVNPASFVNPSGDIGPVIYIKTSVDDYVILLNDIDYLNLEEGTILTVDNMIALKKYYVDNVWKVPEMIIQEASEAGSEIRDTDTRAAYIGTDSIFSDINDDLASYINELEDLGIITGYEDGSFRPDGTLTRAEASAMIGRMMHYSAEYDGRFADVPADAWYASELAALVEKGIINGTSDNTFSPEETIKYVDILKIIEGVLDYKLTNSNDDYAEWVIDKAMQIGLTTGIDSFETQAPARRGNIAIIISNALDTHIHTYITEVTGGYTESSITFEMGREIDDITLIDYINGGKLNGEIR